MQQPSDGQDSDKSDESEQKPNEAGAVGGNPESATELNQQISVRRKLKSTFGRWQKGLNKETSKKKKGVWAKFSRRLWRNPECEINGSSVGTRCICTAYQKTEENPRETEITTEPDNVPHVQQRSRRGSLTETQRNSTVSVVDLSRLNTEYFSADDWDERARQERAKEIEEGVDPPPGYRPSRAEINFAAEFPVSELTLSLGNNLRITAPYPYLERFGESLGLSRDLFIKICERRTSDSNFFSAVHTQVDYVHCLVPDLLEITNCSFYWGKMDRYEAEKLLENKPEGTFLLRDSAQEEYLFSVSFRRYGRSLHARIEQWNHKFSFDSHDPGVFASSTVCGLIEHYKDPSCCMFFEPMLTIPLHRIFPFSLQHLCRAVICGHINYDGINKLQLPKSLKTYLKDYHYKQRVRIRHFEIDH